MNLRLPEYIGPLKKMTTLLQDPVQYTLPVGEATILLNPLLGQKITLRYLGEIYCVQCKRKITKSFQQGYCFPCYKRLLECGLCIIHPEKCRYYEGLCKPEDWAHAHCTVAHVVYLANSSGLKVGITRASHFCSRWIDQGASQGMVIFNVANRYLAGLVEVALKQFVADKTNWQAMLKAENHAIDLIAKREEILVLAKQAMADLIGRFPKDIQVAETTEITQLNYPILQYPLKIKALDLEKEPLVEGLLQGIKGQYLLLDSGVISIRKFSGYQIQWIVN